MDRYEIALECIGWDETILEVNKDSEGEWVKYEDVEKLKADNAKLREGLKELDKDDWIRFHAYYGFLIKDLLEQTSQSPNNN